MQIQRFVSTLNVAKCQAMSRPRLLLIISCHAPTFMSPHVLCVFAFSVTCKRVQWQSSIRAVRAMNLDNCPAYYESSEESTVYHVPSTNPCVSVCSMLLNDCLHVRFLMPTFVVYRVILPISTSIGSRLSIPETKRTTSGYHCTAFLEDLKPHYNSNSK